MGIAITQEQQALAETVRDWAAHAVPPEAPHRAPDTSTGAARPPYRDGLARLGLPGLRAPEAYGGGGGTVADLAVALEETGRALLPGPYVPTVLAVELLLRGAQPGPGDAADAGRPPEPSRAVRAVRSRLVRQLAEGARTAAVALGTGSLTAEPAPDGGHVLHGTAPPVLGAAGAELLVLAAESPGHGTVWLAVDADALTVRARDSADPLRPVADVLAERVTVPAARTLAVDTALVRDLAAVLFSAEACGVAARALDTAAGHAVVREQFGRPVGSFQAVKHGCAEMLVRLAQARALTWDAARAVDEPAPVRGLAAALAASVALEAAYEGAKDCVQLLGATGFSREHDAHLALRRALTVRQLLGPGHRHRLRAARLAADGGTRRALRLGPGLELGLELPPDARAEADTFRARAREAADGARGLDPAEARRRLAPDGYAEPHLPPPYGLGAGPVQQLVVGEELRAAGVRVSELGVTACALPALVTYGTEAQRARHLPGTVSGETAWCQLFSEPDAGSDMAALRTRAERVPGRGSGAGGGGWRVNGQKAWISAAQSADWGVLLARTDPEAPTERALTFFLVDMRNTPGLEVRPVRDIAGGTPFGEVYLDGVLLPEDAVVGEVHDGWAVARHTLGNGRVDWTDRPDFGPGLEALLARCPYGDDAGPVRERLGALAAEAHALGCLALRTVLRRAAGQQSGADPGVHRLLRARHQQRVAELALELLGPPGALTDEGGAVDTFLTSRGATLSGGTTQIQLNALAETHLSLPHDPEPRPLL
ncbi:acyl-CoA dehydrogenase [Streptomyces armeniacus]|uniref:Acyl-CoA dehydrogenase n=1 Tax=Streptomyces armeniacus TaxID=83291 RepID=A0A345XTH2_9ACTN|nr:acyl-CoA dehydrogenase [Streptomyces armeniacus]AXK34938.1 acyl-CoA dehydrogenase [Streptomyces armeniacus]